MKVKKILAALLAMAMLLSMMSITAFAQTQPKALKAPAFGAAAELAEAAAPDELEPQPYARQTVDSMDEVNLPKKMANAPLLGAQLEAPEGAVAYVTNESGAPVGEGDGELGAGYYATLQAAINACPTDNTQATITMLAHDMLTGDENDNAGWEIKENRNILLDLNGYKLCLFVTADKASHVISINSGATLTLEDNSEAQTGLVYNSITNDVHVGEWWVEDPETGYRPYNYETNIITNEATFILNSGRLQNNGLGSICYALCSKPNSDTVINGGKIDGTHGGATIRLYHHSAGNINFTMNGGSIGTEEKPAFIGISSQLSGANVTGSYTITGGEFIGDGWWYWNEEYQERQYGFAIYSSSGSGSAINWDISGGTFKNFAIAAYPSCGENVSISGGRFIKAADSTYSLLYDCDGITGGYFSEDVSSQVADGYYCVKNTDAIDKMSADKDLNINVDKEETGLKFKVGTEEPDDVCKIVSANGQTETPYKSFNAALLAVKTDETIVLLDDCEATTNYFLGYGYGYNDSLGFTVDLNGHMLDASKNSFYTYNYDFAYLTFKNSDTENEAVLNLAGFAINTSTNRCANSYCCDEPFNLTFENVTVNENDDYAVLLGTKYSIYGERNTLLTLNNATLNAAEGVRFPNYFCYGVEVNCVENSYNSIELEDETGLCMCIYSEYNNDPIQLTGAGNLEISGGQYGIYSYGGIEITGTGKVNIHDVNYGLENWGYDGHPDTITISNPNMFVSAGNDSIYCKYEVYGNVTAGYYSNDVCDYCADGYGCLNLVEGTPEYDEGYRFKVVHGVATIGDELYTSLENAIAAAKDGETIILLNDVTTDEDFKTSKLITIDMNNHTINGKPNPYSIVEEKYGAKEVKEDENGDYTIRKTYNTVNNTDTAFAYTVTLPNYAQTKQVMEAEGSDFDVVINESPKTDIELAEEKFEEVKDDEKEYNDKIAFDIKAIETKSTGIQNVVKLENEKVVLKLAKKVNSKEDIVIIHIKSDEVGEIPLDDNDKKEQVTEFDLKEDKQTVEFTASSFSTYFVAYAAMPIEGTDITKIATITFERQANTNVYDIYANAETGKLLNRLSTVDLVFGNEVTEGNIAYNIKSAPYVNLIDAGNDRYEFNFNGIDYADSTGEKTKIGTVEFVGYGKGTFSVVTNNPDTNVIHTAKLADNIVDEYVATGDTVTAGQLITTDKIDYEIAPEKRVLTVNIAYNNNINDNATAYQDMKVTISGGDLAASLVYNLGSDFTATTDETLAFNSDAYKLVVANKLTQNIAYTVTVEGAGYRTARYTVTMTADKTLNFWNNVKDTAVVIEDGKTAPTMACNFLAGDIVKDNNINIYDLSAVVSYFGTDNLVSANPAYAKYDLNRDGKIDSKDVAYVLVSWGK